MKHYFSRRYLFQVAFIVSLLAGKGTTSPLKDCLVTNVFSTGSYNVDLSSLEGTWESVYIEGTDIHSDIVVPRFYNVSLFTPFSNDQCKGNHICYTETFDSFHTLGKHGSCKYHSEDKIISIVYDYDSGVYGDGNVTVNLICGPTLGVPEVLEGDPRNRVVEILWITSAACKPNTDKPKHHETKCYNLKHSIDPKNGIQAEFTDFSGLIRDIGYEATMTERPDIKMNVSVCRPMVSNDACDGSNVCLYQGDSHLHLGKDVKFPIPLGHLSTSGESVPHYESGVLSMVFSIKEDNIKCKQKSPFIRIGFYCPKGDEALGPHIEYIDDDLCVTIIAWNTMHACDINTVQSSTLTLTTSQGTSFDLRGLPEVTVTDDAGHNTNAYSYTIHPSTKGNLNEGCQEDNPSPIHVIQSENGSAVCRSLGQGAGKLRYIDNVLTLTYTNGDTCSDGFARTSIITFVCPNDVVGGAKHCDSSNASDCVTFTFESHCLYEFEWVTDTACGSGATSSSSCRFSLNEIDYNLGLLIEDYKSTYAAIATGDATTECYLINPCGIVEVTALTNLTSSQYCNQRVAPQESCDQSSICRIPKTGTTKGESFGFFDFSVSSNIHSVVKDVVAVATKPSSLTSHRAAIQYICQPGSLSTSPVFISHETNSISEFHWYTFAACPQGVTVGSDCLVTQSSSGFTFNLSSLSNQIFNFTDKLHKFNYSISICNKFPEGRFQGSCSSNSAMCQHTSSSHKSAGQMNTTLVYADSALKLHYMNGQACSSGDVRHTTILFMCNPDMHTAIVRNVTEIEHCSYVVEMETKLACPPAYRSTECVYFAPNGDSYDLTQLQKTNGNWEARGSDGSTYLINVCRPLDLLGVGQCNPLSSICKVPDSGHSANSNTDLGLASTASFGPPPKSADSHVTLVLNYTHSSTSNKDCSVIYSSIQFICNRSAPLDAGPRHISGGGVANPCEYTFLWETRLVCPIEIQEVKACNITDEATGYTYDLTPLTTHHNNLYTVMGTDGNNYMLTLCGALSGKSSECHDDGTAVCQSLGSGRNYNSGKYSAMELTYMDKSLSLYYRDGEKCSKGDVRTTQIDFLCDRLVAGDDYFGSPTFVSESSHCHYLFQWSTPLACPPAELECVAAGGKYNLKPLMEKRNWLISGLNGQQIVIGGCQAIDSTYIPECAPSVKVGACQYTPNNANSSNHGDILGYLTGDLVEVEEGHLKLSYHNGKMCLGEGRRSVVNVHFHCKPSAGAGNPVLDSSGCVTEITWDTQYACAQDNSSIGWTISNSATGQTFDLTSLPDTMTTERDGYTYSVGLVGHTVPCGGEENVIVCQTSSKSGHTHVLAKKEDTFRLQLVGGKVQFTIQNGEKCRHHNQINRKVSVFFEYDSRGNSLMALEEQGCEYSFVVFTPLVKEKDQQIGIQCYVENFPDLEWFASYPTPPIPVESNNARVYFSVCNPIQSSNQQNGDEYEPCQDISGACYVRGSDILNLGRPSIHSPPVVSPDGNAVQITYLGGDDCPDMKKSFTTKILLVCSNVTGGVPEMTYFNKTTCEAIIVWRSPHACPHPIPMTPVSDSVCKIVDPSEGSVLDLSSLAVDGTQIQTVDGMYIIGLCGPVTRGADKCNNKHAGVCHNDDGNWMKMVDANHTLTLVSHSPHAIDLQYSTGTSCGLHNTWTVTVHIYCTKKQNSEKPFYESSSDCELRFSWPTSALCLTEVEGCYVSYPDNSILDLEPLVSQSWKGTYISNGDRLGEFNVSVCRNLNPTVSEGSHCFPGPAGICFRPDVSKNEYKNLGHMTSPPSISDDGSIALHYSKGSACKDSTTGATNISTTVYLKCPVSSYEAPPQIRSTSSPCKYEVDWTTQTACKHSKEESGSCVVNDPHSGVQYNFKPLAKQFTFKDDSSGVSYSVCLCPNGKACNTGIIQTDGDSSTTNLGSFHQLVVYPNAGPQFNFIGGDKCPGNNKYSSTVMMFCDRGIENEKGKFVYEEGLSMDCHKYFSWWTPVACTSPQISCVIQQPFYDFTPIYPPNGSWVAKDKDNHEEYLINICGPIHVEGSNGCSGNTAICHKKRDGSYHDLAFASTQTLTINSNHHPEIHFSSTEKCSSGKYSTVVIEMICGIQGLKFRGKDSCKYRFDWHTTYACQESERFTTQNNCNTFKENDNMFYPGNLLSDSGYHVSSNINGMQYHVNMCGDETNDCGEGVAVCQTTKNHKYELGTTKSLSVSFDSYWMRFSFTGTDGSSVITVECADGDGTGSPEEELDTLVLENEFINSDKKRIAYFRMYSKKACKFEEPPSTTPPPSGDGGGTSSGTNSSSKVNTAIIIIILVVILIVVIVITMVLWNKDRREKVLNKLSSLVSPKANEPVKYVRARTNDTEASLMEDSNSSEEDEEPLVVNALIGKQDGDTPLVDSSSHTGATAIKLKKQKKKKDELPPLAEYKDEDERLSDDELLNL